MQLTWRICKLAPPGANVLDSDDAAVVH
jgi:hypothetical protein